jgi:small subunit ribosomal protein S8
MNNDPIADMLTRVRNALLAGHATVTMPSSKIKLAIAEILQEEGFITGMEVIPEKPQAMLLLKLKYIGRRRDRRPVIKGLERVSRPGRRIYTGKAEIPWVQSGMGVAILSTSKGVMTGQKARGLSVGGEILCRVW